MLRCHSAVLFRWEPEAIFKSLLCDLGQFSSPLFLSFPARLRGVALIRWLSASLSVSKNPALEKKGESQQNTSPSPGLSFPSYSRSFRRVDPLPSKIDRNAHMQINTYKSCPREPEKSPARALKACGARGLQGL